MNEAEEKKLVEKHAKVMVDLFSAGFAAFPNDMTDTRKIIGNYFDTVVENEVKIAVFYSFCNTIGDLAEHLYGEADA